MDQCIRLGFGKDTAHRIRVEKIGFDQLKGNRLKRIAIHAENVMRACRIQSQIEAQESA